MARMPGALWQPLAADWAAQPRMRAYDIICIHTMVGGLIGTDGYFRTGNGLGYAGTESHFGTGGGGEIVQWQDTAHQADANLNGNWHVLSIENADMGPGFPPWNINDAGQIPGFTEAQMDAIARVIAWACREHSIPCALIPNAKPGVRGIGYHRQGVPGYMVAGAEQWSSANRKSCPGDRRIAQVPEVIRRAQTLLGQNPPPPPSRDAPPRLGWPIWWPAGHYVGDRRGPDRSHGGGLPGERDFVRNVQQWLIYHGCVPGQTNWRSGWADGLFDAPYSTQAARRWHDRFYPGQQFPEQIWRDDYDRLARP